MLQRRSKVSQRDSVPCRNLILELGAVVARAWQVLGDTNLKAQYDAAPDVDPTSRFSQTSSRRSQGFGGADMSPEELFEMFFNGGFAQGGGFNGRPGSSAASFASQCLTKIIFIQYSPRHLAPTDSNNSGLAERHHVMRTTTILSRAPPPSYSSSP